jgi:CDP-paratose 2-epimerase
MNKLLVTGSSGRIGSEVVEYFCQNGWDVCGLDNNMRADFFGPAGDTRWNRDRLLSKYKNFRHHEIDIRARPDVLSCLESIRPGMIVHAASQPSHDLPASRPFDDFDVNASGTMNLLEATRRTTPEAIFVFLSTNKVYGDRPNTIKLKELETRWDYDDSAYVNGIGKTFSIDQSTHSLFGASKVAADIMVQEYGRYFDMKTCILRGGCLTGPNHSGVELHGFLKCNAEGRLYRIYGYKGKQVRDNIHSVDVARFIHAFWERPRCAEVYNLGGGRENSCSILEAFDLINSISGMRSTYEYVDQNRQGDHICYISDLRKMKAHYPKWHVTKSLNDIFGEIFARWHESAEGRVHFVR